MKSTNTSSKNSKTSTVTSPALNSTNSAVVGTSSEIIASAAVAIKLEPAETLSKFDDILKKRKADRLAAASSTSHSESESSGIANSGNSSCTAAMSTKKAKLSVLEEKASNHQHESSASSSSSSILTTPPRPSPQQKTVVQFNIFCVEGDTPGEEVPAAVTICNIYGLKDILLGNKTLPNGDNFYWPARMLYPHQVGAVMNAFKHIHPSSAEFLQTSNGRPLIALSCLSKVKDTLLSFHEVVEFLQNFIQDRTDESSNGTPKKTFDLNIVRRVLTEAELDALVAISPTIGVKAASV